MGVMGFVKPGPVTKSAPRKCRRRGNESLINYVRARELEFDQRLVTSSPTMDYQDFVAGPGQTSMCDLMFAQFGRNWQSSSDDPRAPLRVEG
jgi:hypothetical protein